MIACIGFLAFPRISVLRVNPFAKMLFFILFYPFLSLLEFWRMEAGIEQKKVLLN